MDEATRAERRATLTEQAVAVKVLGELLKGAEAAVRSGLLAELLDDYHDTEETKFAAAAFGFDDVGSLSLHVPQDKVVVDDPDAFLAYVEEHFPDQVETIYRPLPDWQKSFLGTLLITGEEPVNPITEKPVPGVKIERGGDPTRFNINLSKNTAQALAQSVLKRTVSAIAAPAGTPALAATGEE